MAKLGRPSLGPDAKTRHLNIHLTEAEHAAVMRFAKRQNKHFSLSAVLRDLVAMGLRAEVPRG